MSYYAIKNGSFWLQGDLDRGLGWGEFATATRFYQEKEAKAIVKRLQQTTLEIIEFQPDARPE